ncbi:MAG: glutamate--tRNA ligase [Rhodospirillales bacterium]|nr:glutamate--tRNA ligase [Rhodospirillales bacterium]
MKGGAVRFAPSPTGLMHVGNARLALVNWLFARAHAGTFVLRLDDTDRERSRAEFAQAIEQDLRWLGLAWDRYESQSARLSSYDEACARLRAAGRLYACYETGEELDYMRRRQIKAGKPPIYDRAALKLDESDRQRLESEGRKAHWRFRLEHKSIRWDDLVRGPQEFRGENLSDPVVVRADGTYLYMLPSAVDDADMAITHVIRGEDHVTNTAIQIQMLDALGAPVPAFAHLPLMTDASGAKLSKRLGSVTLESLRKDGIEPMAINSLLARLGTSEAVEPHLDLDALVATFDITRFGRAQPRFDPAELKALNAKLLHMMPYAMVAERLTALGLGHADARFWDAVRRNLERLEDAGVWHGVCYAVVTPAIEETEFVREAAKVLPPDPWSETTYGTWTEAVGERTGRKGKALFLPLRLALTGRSHGPELKTLLPLIGRKRAFARLHGEAA